MGAIAIFLDRGTDNLEEEDDDEMSAGVRLGGMDDTPIFVSLAMTLLPSPAAFARRGLFTADTTSFFDMSVQQKGHCHRRIN